MKRLLGLSLIGLVLSLAWLSMAASKQPEYTFSCTGVMDRYDEGWATIQTDYGQDWLLPLATSELAEGGVYRITIVLVADGQLQTQQETKVSQLLLTLLNQPI